MCTVTLIPLAGNVRRRGGDGSDAKPPLVPGFMDDSDDSPAGSALAAGVRMVCNRDESRARPLALPPEIRRFSDRRAIMPIDPVSNGTWVAVNDAGIAATLLNVYPHRKGEGDPFSGRSSRGSVIPRLLSATNMGSIERQVGSLNPSDHPPFRLVITDAREIVELVSDGTTFQVFARSISGRPHFFTSSGLGDAVVDGPRRALFDEMFAVESDWITTQAAFHRHGWPDRPNISVCMRRPDAHTVSCTRIDIGSDCVSLQYTPGAPDRTEALPPMRLAIGRNAG